jgi:ElaB/YqjD/DUF883 family membrane-anchored ribosome-binding protein
LLTNIVPFRAHSSSEKRARNCPSLFLQGFRTLSYYEIRVWPDCEQPQPRLRKAIPVRLVPRKDFLQIKNRKRKMTNENMIGSRAGESNPQNKRAQSAREERRPEVEAVKSTATALKQDYTEKAGKALDEAKQRVRTLREDGEDYVRENPMKAVCTALGVGFMLGLIFKR